MQKTFKHSLQGVIMSVFVEIRFELESLSDLELVEVARESYGLDIDLTESRQIIIDQCIAIEQHNFYR